MSVTEEKEFVLRFSLRAKFAEDEDSDDHERMPERVLKHNLDATDEVSRPRS